ncbi:MAG: hypothetical protein IJ776_06590 [Paludibacteraceae bacterium]|nr:hypothetical protein [Paludibacteraceae bacterium]
MKNPILCAITCAFSLLLTSCYYNYPEVKNENQYVHQFLLQNNATGRIALRAIDNDGGFGEAAKPGGYICAEVIINNLEVITDNVKLSLTQGAAKSTKYMSLSVSKTEEDANGWTQYDSENIPLSADVDISPYWSANYLPVSTNDIPDFVYKYRGEVKEGHVKTYVLSVSDEYLDQLKETSKN